MYDLICVKFVCEVSQSHWYKQQYTSNTEYIEYMK